jgi:hypothetical protein
MSARPQSGLLARLVALDILEPAHAEALAARAPPPWWLAALQGIAAWLASLFIIASFSAPLILLIFGEGPVGRLVCGAALLGAAIWLFRRRQVFTDQMALAFSLAGQSLVVGAFAGDFSELEQGYRTLAAVSILVAAAMTVPPSTQLHRVVCALLIVGNLGVLIGPGDPLLAYSVLLTAVAVGSWLARERWAAQPWAARFGALATAATLAALVAAWGVGAEFARELLQGVTPLIYRAGVAFVLLAAVGWLSRAVAAPLRLALLTGTLLFVVAAWQAPGLMVSAAVFLAAFHACHRPLAVLALVAGAYYLSAFYYSLEATLLVKSGALAATGLVLLGLRLALKRSQRRAA